MGKKRKAKVYREVVGSELGERYAPAFKGMRMEPGGGGTVLTGEVKDMPHLFGILQRLNGLGLELLSVRGLPEGAPPSAQGLPDSHSPACPKNLGQI